MILEGEDASPLLRHIGFTFHAPLKTVRLGATFEKWCECLAWQLPPQEGGSGCKTRGEGLTGSMADWPTVAADGQEGSPTPLARERDGILGALTSVEHGAVAELCPVPTTAQQGVVGNHGGVVASSPTPAFRAPPPVRLRERRRCQGRALERGTWGCAGVASPLLGGNSPRHRGSHHSPGDA